MKLVTGSSGESSNQSNGESSTRGVHLSIKSLILRSHILLNPFLQTQNIAQIGLLEGLSSENEFKTICHIM